MSGGPFRFDSYDWPGGREHMLIRGTSIDRHVILIAPLFEEMNFTRALLAQVGRELARRGVTSWLPDLPGIGESRQSLASLGWEDWRAALAACAAAVGERTGRPVRTCAFRGGALLDDAVAGSRRWRYAPVSGESLLRQMRRAQLVTDREAGAPPAAEGEIVSLAGYVLSGAMRDGLAATVPATADREAPEAGGPPLWRRAEPGRDDVLAEILAADIDDWTRACGDR